MKSYNVCPIRNILDRFGDKWSILILLQLEKNSVMRFSQLSKEITDISQKMLTVTLRTLETDGLIDRKVYAEVPPRVEYKLTEAGHSLMPHIGRLVDWALENRDVVINSRILHNADVVSGTVSI